MDSPNELAYRKAFGKRLRDLRKEKGLSREFIANRLNMSVSAYGFYETGRNLPSVSKIPTIAEALQTTTDELLGRKIDVYPAAKQRLEKNGFIVTENKDGSISVSNKIGSIRFTDKRAVYFFVSNALARTENLLENMQKIILNDSLDKGFYDEMYIARWKDTKKLKRSTGNE